MAKIDIDFEVFKTLTAMRENEKMTENDVIRKLLGLAPKQQTVEQLTKSLLEDWTVKGVTFPTGTQFRAEYKGSWHLGVVQSRALVVNGVRCPSPSKAARVITGHSTNGWNFWECKLPNEEHWVTISSLRTD